MIDYKTGIDCIDWNQLCDLYGEVGLVGIYGERKDYDAIKLAFTNSSKVVTAWDAQYLIGAGRLISDGICHGTIFDVGVLPKYRRKGIATSIMEELLKGTENFSIYLTSAFGIEGLYKKTGFKRHKNAFARYPYPSEYLEDI